jgi:hypothetical protein
MSEKAAELGDKASKAMDDMGAAIKKGAAEASDTVKDTLSKGEPPVSSPEAEKKAGQY